MSFSNVTEQPKAERSSAATSRQRIGDLLIGFGTDAPNAGRSSSTPWTDATTGPGWNLWQQPVTSAWNGFPLRHIKATDWQIWLLGELYDQNDATESLLIEAVRTGAGAKNLNGHFLLLAWNETRREWHLWTNRFGTLHAYHAQSGNVAVLGTCAGAVSRLASNRQLDWRALTGFFGFGFFPSDLTHFADVRVLAPATHYVFDTDGKKLSARRYWDWNYEPDLNRSYDDTVAEFAEIFGTVMRDHFREGRVAVPISGGLDSRCTVAAIEPLHSTSFWSYSYGYGACSIETTIARQIAKARELPFMSFEIEPYLFQKLDEVLAAVEGFQDITQCRQAMVKQELRQNADCVIAAHWGDVWLDDMGLAAEGKNSEFRISNSESIIDHTLGKMAKRGRQWLLENICAPQNGNGCAEDLLRNFVAEGMGCLEQIEDPDFRVKAFKTDNWSFRWTLASIRMFQSAAFPRLPFYDTRLADFFCTVPSTFVKGRQLQVDYLKRFAPDLARIKWQVHDADLFSYQRSRISSLSRRAFKKIGRALSGEKVLQRNWEVQFAGVEGRRNLEQWLTRPGLKLHEFVGAPKVRELIEHFYNTWPNPECGYTISMLLTFSAWLENNA